MNAISAHLEVWSPDTSPEIAVLISKCDLLTRVLRLLCTYRSVVSRHES